MSRVLSNRLPLFTGLILLFLSQIGCSRKPQAEKEGEIWKCPDLLTYLQQCRLKLVPLDEPTKIEGGDVSETTYWVDDETAPTRKTGNVVLDAVSARRAGTGSIICIRYSSLEVAKRQPRPADDSSLLWGRFIVVVVGAQPKGSEQESGNARSRKIVQDIRRLLSE